ncbi:MAG TPA: hypothetical protein VE076_12175 [Nitrososphaeraceae archaeon]|nr:hypothetical protein [Nitrososphaeraceae archaeon]
MEIIGKIYESGIFRKRNVLKGAKKPITYNILEIKLGENLYKYLLFNTIKNYR